MTNEKLICNQICTWNDPSDGCVRPNGRTCPMSSVKVDTSWRGKAKMANKTQLIDLDLLISDLEKMESYNCSPMYRRGYDDCISAIKRQAVVDVVRCGDCKMEYGCRVAQWLGENGFCSYGERRTDG